MWITALSENAGKNSFADSNFPWRQSTGLETLDAKVNSALSRIVLRDLSRKVKLENGACAA